MKMELIAMSSIDKLIKQFAKLPRVGNRSATRIVIDLLQDKSGRGITLAKTLIDTINSIKPCENCGVLNDGACPYCNNATRQNGQLCIVRDLSDVWVLEKSGVFSGRYHIIGGLLSAMNGIGPNELNTKNLSNRIKNENITEIIFALPNTIEGKTTSLFIKSLLTDDLDFTELASGVPLGGDLDYIDDGTLTLAFGGRKKL